MQEAVQADGIAERRERLWFKRPPRLLGVGCDRVRVKADQRRPLVGFRLIGQQRIEPTAEAATPECAGRGRVAQA